MYSAKQNGNRVLFGTSGLLYLSNKLMFDRETNSLWRQFTGEPVVGPLAESGIVLERLPVVLTTWEEWLAEHPDTTVLDDDTGIYRRREYIREQNPNSVYFEYRRTSDLWFPVWQRSGLLEDKGAVLGVRVGDAARAYPLDALRQEPVLNDRLGDTNLVLLTTPGSGAVRAYRRGDHLFDTISPGGNNSLASVTDQNGEIWHVTEDALVNALDAGERLERIPSSLSFWFGWFATYPETDVYGADN